MSRDNWERLVAAVIKKQQLLELFHAHSRTPSILSEASSSFSYVSEIDDIPFAYSVSFNKSQNPNLVFFSDYEPISDLDDLLGASTEILGRGTFTIVRTYKLNYETTIVVKRLLKMVNISQNDFKKHITMIGDVKHENVAELRAYCYSKHEKLMICDYYGSGSVSALLHEKPGNNRAKVDWKARLRIAIGAARGISHIHAQKGGQMVHGNIKASNIFLNSQGYGVVSELGLARMVETTFPHSSRCYAPEVKSTRDVSQASDVYSFGILLLQLVSRKSPDLSLGLDQAVDLVQLVNYVNREEWDMTVFDKDLLFTPSIQAKIWKVFEIGKCCLDKSPEKRPKMLEVVKMIEDVSMMNMRNQDSVKSKSVMIMGNLVSGQLDLNKLVFLRGSYRAFDLEDLLRASGKVLGNGRLNTTYEVVLEKGFTVCVKGLKDVIVTSEEFQQYVEVIGKMEHEYVTDLRAYYYSKDKKFLVYDYYNHGSLSATLHGTRNSDKIPLDWNARIKVAVSAAKGIAHIHTRNGRNLVHGNIRASNIHSSTTNNMELYLMWDY